VSKTAIDVQPKLLNYYLSLEYPMTVYPDSEGGFVAEIKELPGCIAQGETIEEVMENISEARELWIETVYESGKREILLPSTRQEYSGKFVLRLPKSLHCRLAEQAEREGISLNQYAVSLLSQAFG
jgi:antitoxin HicB